MLTLAPLITFLLSTNTATAAPANAYLAPIRTAETKVDISRKIDHHYIVELKQSTECNHIFNLQSIS
jgi:hypothetical protein